MKTKICTKCNNRYPATVEYFSSDIRYKNNLRPQCRICRREVHQKYRLSKKGCTTTKMRNKKYDSTIKGRLINTFHRLNNRCNNSGRKDYKNYGGRGIKNLFKSSNEFVEYAVNVLGYDTYDKIRGLQIDRINNDGNYEPGNIRFVTVKANNNNRRKRRNRKLPCKNKNG
ncbi:MAG TPA: hypothetical protein ENH85_13180 [Candidatus Scalindua sp.]|nr:hypothetical protein [Candidatus Scalindua sp.]